MSTTFEVYPSTEEIPSFRQVIDLASSQLETRLSQLNVCPELEIACDLRSAEDDQIAPFDADRRFQWPDTMYAWFTVAKVGGGTDAYFEHVDELTLDVWSDYLKQPRLARNAGDVRRCLSIGHYWTFRRSAGQPATINLLYGLIAGCLAKLVDGFVFSDDSAWVWELMPIRGDDFLDRYFTVDGTPEKKSTIGQRIAALVYLLNWPNNKAIHAEPRAARFLKSMSIAAAR